MLLAIDASTELCAVALGMNSYWTERSEHAGQRHSELLVPMIRTLLSDAKQTLAALEGIAFGAGPGSFTGLRIACGVAQGLALGARLPLIGVSTLEAIAETARRRNGAARVIAALDARMGEVYVAAYEFDGQRWQEKVAPEVVKPETTSIPEGGGWHGAGNGFAAHPELREHFSVSLATFDPDVVPSATAVGILSLPRFAAGEGIPAREAVPHYVRHRVALTIAERAAGARL